MKRLVYGVGNYRRGNYVCSNNGIVTRVYSVWAGMLERCYSELFLKKRPTYLGCSVSENFKDFQKFAEWYQVQAYSEKIGYQLDKDILFEGNKVYDEDTSVFVPSYMNSFFTGSNATRGNCPIGVSYRGDRGKFVARLSVDNRLVHLGEFNDVETAMRVYKVAKESQARQLAKKTLGLVDIRVTNALNNFVVNFNN